MIFLNCISIQEYSLAKWESVRLDFVEGRQANNDEKIHSPEDS